MSTKQYVEFLYLPVEVADRSPPTIPEGAYAYRFFARKVTGVGRRVGVLTGPREDFSDTVYLGDEPPLTLDDISPAVDGTDGELQQDRDDALRDEARQREADYQREVADSYRSGGTGL